MSESASDSSSSKVEANRDSLIADENRAWEFGEVVEKDALRVGTDDGRPNCGELGLRPDDSLGQTAGPPEGVRIDCREGEARKP